MRKLAVSEPQVHTFEDTQDAYDSSQSEDNIHDGDVLVTPKSIAILTQAWPIVVTGEQGEFHTLKSEYTWETLNNGILEVSGT